LARQRRQARHRFVQSAAVMVATFVLTTSSAVFLAGLQGINVHSETWQIATAWLTSVEVEPSMPGRPGITEAIKAPAMTPVTASPSKAPSRARSGKNAAEPPAKAQTKGVSASPKVAAAANDPAQQATWWPW
jgi:hypothetical protein